MIAAAESGDTFNISDLFSHSLLCSDDTSSNGSNSDRDSGIETGNAELGTDEVLASSKLNKSVKCTQFNVKERVAVPLYHGLASLEFLSHMPLNR